MSKKIEICGKVLWLSNPSSFNHESQTFNLMGDNSFMSLLHQVYMSREDIENLDVVIPKISDDTRKHLTNINDNIFAGLINFIEVEKGYSTTHFSNDEKMCQYLASGGLQKEINKSDIIVSEISFDFGCEVLYYFPYFQRLNKLSEGSEKLDVKVDFLIRKYERGLLIVDAQNIDVFELENDSYIDFFYFGQTRFSEELFDALCRVFTIDISEQVKDVIESAHIGKRISLFDRDLVFYNEELETILKDDEYLKKVDTLIISNRSNIDDSYALSIVFESGYGVDRDDSTNLVIFDRSDDVDKDILKYQLANTGKVITYYTDTLFSHDIELFKAMGCEVIRK